MTSQEAISLSNLSIDPKWYIEDHYAGLVVKGGPFINVKKHTFYYFVQAILPEKFTPSERYYAISRLSEQGLVDILKPKG